MKKRTKRFTAFDHSERSFVIEEWTEYLESHTFEGSAVTEGMKSLITASGEKLNRLEKGVYQIRLTGAVLRSADPDAS